MNVATFHTPDAYYQRAADEMSTRCGMLGIGLDMLRLETTIGWNAVTRFKPEYVKEVARRGYPFFWIDVDCEIRKHLEMPGLKDVDLGFVPARVNGVAGKLPVRAAVIYFNATEGARRFIDLWEWCTGRIPSHQSDHHGLVQAWGALEWMPEIRYMYLPQTYCAFRNQAQLTWDAAVVRIGLAHHARKDRDMAEYRSSGGDDSFKLLTYEEYEEWTRSVSQTG